MKRYLFISLVAVLTLLGWVSLSAADVENSTGKSTTNKTGFYNDGYLSADPGSGSLKSKMGFWYLKTGRIDEAISEFETALKKEPGEPLSTYYLGLAYLNKGDFEKAIRILQSYRNRAYPQVEEEIGRQLTLLQIANNRRIAAKALAEEDKLMAVKPDPNTVAVCYFQDISPDNSLQPFQKAIAAMVISDLTKIKSIRVVERIRLQALLEEMRLGQTGIVDLNTAPKIGKLLGAENVMVGSLSLGSIRAVAALASSGGGSVKGNSSVSVDNDKFFELPMAIVRDTVNIMGISLTDEEKKATGVPHTKAYNAVVSYGKALDALDAGKWKEANDYFNLALKEDPAFDLAIQGADTCPSADSPSVNSISGASGPNLSAKIEAAVSKASNLPPETEKAPAAETGKEVGEVLTVSSDAGGKETVTETATNDNASGNVAQTQTSVAIEAQDLWPANKYGYFIAMVTKYSSGEYSLDDTFASDSLQDLNGTNLSATGIVYPGTTMYVDGLAGDNGTITSIVDPYDHTTGGPYPISRTELDHNAYMVWGYWTQTDPMYAISGDYGLVNNRGYYIAGDNTSDIQHLSGNIFNYSGGAEGTYFTANDGLPGGGINMTGSFNATVNFSNPSFTDFDLSVSGGGHSASITNGSGPLHGSEFMLSGGMALIDGVTPQIVRAGGSVYGPDAQAIGGIWGMSRGEGPPYYNYHVATGIFHGTR